jgi:hypothetical protein
MAYIKLTVGRDESEPFPEDAQPVEIEETNEEHLRDQLRAEIESEMRSLLESERQERLAAEEALAAAGASEATAGDAASSADEASAGATRSGIRARLGRISVGDVVSAVGVVVAVYGLARVMVRREEVAQVARIELEPDEPAY